MLRTCERIARLIEDCFGVEHHPSYLARVLHGMAFSPQTPRTVAREQDPEAFEHWCKVEWPRIEKTLRRGAFIVFLNETGFLLQLLTRRTRP